MTEESKNNIPIFLRAWYFAKYKIHFVIKYVILNLFYRGHFDPRMLNIHVGRVMTIFFFQKILRLNSHVPYPIYHTNILGSLDKADIAPVVFFELATSGGVHIQAMNGLEIGAGTIIASGAKIYSANHDFYDFDKHQPGDPVRIGKNCWLGANSVILAGVQLGERTIVAAGAVVNKSFPGNCIVGGVPAKIIKHLDPISEKLTQ